MTLIYHVNKTREEAEMHAKMLQQVAPYEISGDPASSSEMLDLLRFLYETGRADLPLGRLVEGHIDAVQIVMRHGNSMQRHAAQKGAKTGNLYGVWNAGDFARPLELGDKGLSGGKTFASGYNILTHALVTADTGAPQGAQLVLLPLDKVDMRIEANWWNTTGMRQSFSQRVFWDNIHIADDWLVGPPGIYETQPWFSAGALRFVAVQAGGIAQIWDTVCTQLVALNRTADPVQCHRMGTLHGLAQSSWDCVQSAGKYARKESHDAFRARVASLRSFVSDSAERAIIIAEQSVGVQSGFVSCPVSQAISDLRVYIRQPGPDAQRIAAGEAGFSGVLTVGPVQ